MRWDGSLPAHPRSRGEHTALLNGGTPHLGSSPLARGTRVNDISQLAKLGLIPARAGNTAFCFPRPPFFWAHPRSRGEHCLLRACVQCRRGSSPLARGTRKTAIHELANFGLIPARAGNTAFLAFYVVQLGAHPRSRGEHRPPVAASASLRGSSPLARGTRFQCVHDAPHAGLIPARAGNTCLLGSVAQAAGAHPRSRGEHAASSTVERADRGSSPLARGTRG